MFFGVNNAALVLRLPLLVLRDDGLGMNYLVSNLLSLVGLTIVRYALADLWIWGKAQREAAGHLRHPRDRHGGLRGRAARVRALPGRRASGRPRSTCGSGRSSGRERLF